MQQVFGPRRQRERKRQGAHRANLLERPPNPKSDRVKITMSGKFLPHKYHGASGNVPEYGFKEG
jgi:hypothetical protein